MCLLAFLLSSIDARAEDRAHTIAAIFDTHCLANSLAFDTVNVLASHLHYPVLHDLGQPDAVRVRSWRVETATGPLELIATEGNGPRGHLVACSIAAPDLDAGQAWTGLLAALHLGPPDSVLFSADHTKRQSTWKNFQDASLVIIDASPAGRTGLIISYEQRASLTKPGT